MSTNDKAKTGGASANSDAASIVVQYHEIRGLAAPLRMMLSYRGVAYKNKFADEWFSKEKAEVKQVNALANLPTVFDKQDNGEVVVTQSCATFWYIGNKLGLNGKTSAEKSRVDQIVCQVQDLRNAVVRHVYKPRVKDSFEAFQNSITGHYEKLEAWFRHNGFIFSASNEITTGDFHLWEMLDQNDEFARAFAKPSFVTSYPLLNAFYARFRLTPELKVCIAWVSKFVKH